MTTITANNGRLPASALTRVRTGQPLRHAPANAYVRLDAFMRQQGHGALTLSAGLSGYRTLADQQHMRNLGLTRIAVGRSPHGEGLAADFQALGGLTGARYRWMRNNAGPFGWFHPTWAQAGGSNPSPHHWEYDQRRDNGNGAPPVTPPPPAETEDEAMMVIQSPNRGIAVAIGNRLVPIGSTVTADGLTAAGAGRAQITDEDFDRLRASSPAPMLIRNASRGFALLTGSAAIGIGDMGTVHAFSSAGVQTIDVGNADFDRLTRGISSAIPPA